MRNRARGPGVVVNPQRVREARLAAGMTMAQLGRDDVSRAFIHMVEHGKALPSQEVLKLIARRTGKPLRYFTGPESDEQLSKQLIASDLVRLAGKVRRFTERGGFDLPRRQSLKLLEVSLRQGAILARNL